MGTDSSEPARNPRKPEKRARKDRDSAPPIWIGYGKLVKLHRQRAGMTQPELAEAVGYSVDTVAAIEQAKRPAKLAFTQGAERELDAQGTLMVLQDEVDRAKLPEFFRDVALLEEEALSRYDWDPLLVPGLLQTEDYARALFSAHCPPLSEDEIELSVEARLSRQRLLARKKPVELCFVIGEAALRNPVGGKRVQREQLEALRKHADLPHMEIQVMPWTCGFHPGLNGPMVVMETAEHEVVGYVESQEAGFVVSDADRVSAFTHRYGKMRSLALNPDESAQFIGRLAGEL
ncbi:helix-turn-helix transcriptional regulator [Streptomyces sp. NBC_01808]|uniref:helix-turn-helix domain-containing protein n=1 Tax=Streptomyces sp. NBC_01808 TaxID=2975947 RepID=UPI002DDC13F0|nr:helix-turn-helix transcriptional regulator [Streptomyces sp. NBC_01808]WSA37149.1 helix-turn-helix transcriptional regulator [Streptomyces sp. NBC_01808]